jgi:hypothetical protein
MTFGPHYRRKLRVYEADTTRQKEIAQHQLAEVAKIVGMAEVMADRLRDAATTFTNRERPEGLE